MSSGPPNPPDENQEVPPDFSPEENGWLSEATYAQLYQIAQQCLRNEPKTVSLSPTILVHETYLRISKLFPSRTIGKERFSYFAARAMRQVLVDIARYRRRLKRSGNRQRLELDETLVLSPENSDDVLALHEALNKLAQIDPRQAQVVELRFFGNLPVQEVAELLQLSKRTVEAEWTAAKAWLRRELSRTLGS